ncbi:MAG: ABC transporter substrate-binding protein [Alicyclobacillaceae bacterium]|nr:ABC transporter substrate-binding protein [Alicyclobacillaceae bacterium]
MRRKWSFAAALFLGGSLLAACGGGAGTTGGNSGGDTIKLGANLELTGSVAAYGSSAKKGMELAIEEINQAGGVLGKKLELIPIDNQSDTTQSTTVAQKLIDQKVVAILGPATTGNTMAELNVATDNKIPIITPTGTALKITVDENTGKTNEYAFRMCFIDPQQGKVGADFVAKELKAKTAVLYVASDSDYAKGLAEAFKKEFEAQGGKVIGQEYYVSKDVDFKTTLTRIKGLNPDVLYIPNYYEDCGKIIKQARELGIKQPIVGGDGYDSDTLVSIAGAENTNNVFFTNHYSADDPDPTIQNFVKKYQAKYNQKPDSFAALGYDTVRLVADAIKRAGEANPVKIKDALAQTKDFEAVTGKMSFDAQHNPVKLVTIIEMKDGKQTLRTKIKP